MSIGFDLTHTTDHGTDPGTDHDSDHDRGGRDERSLETIGGPANASEKLVEVRRRAAVAVALGAGASLVAVAYLARAASGGGAFDWALGVLLALIGVANLAALLDARTPLLVADDLGVRLRLGRTWVGLPWGGLHEVEHCRRRGWWRDGRLVVHTHYVHRVLEDLDPPARRTARLNGRLHHAPLAVPLGLGTRVVGADPDLVSALRALADGRTPIVESLEVEAPTEAPTEAPAPETDPLEPADGLARESQAESQAESHREPHAWRHVVHPDEVAADDHVDADESTEQAIDAPADSELDAVPAARRLPDPRPAIAGLIGRVAGRFDRPVRDQDEADEATESDEALAEDRPDAEEIVASPTPPPGREMVAAARAEVRHESRADLDEALEDETQVWGDLHAAPEVEGALLIDDYVSDPPPDPVIGPQFATARHRLGLTVDELADRTRIRPHVIEAIEVDDFSACGGDFYARGHLRTLARVLGVDGAPVLELYDERYADAPIDPRRVFEAELAGAGSMRATRGGPNWSVLVAAVMALILCWSVARLVTGGPDHGADRAVLSGSGGPNHSSGRAAAPVPVTIAADGGGARVVVRDGNGKLVFSGDLSYGQKHTLRASPPVRVQSTDGSVRVTVDGHPRGRMGPAGRPATQSYVVRR